MAPKPLGEDAIRRFRLAQQLLNLCQTQVLIARERSLARQRPQSGALGGQVHQHARKAKHLLPVAKQRALPNQPLPLHQRLVGIATPLQNAGQLLLVLHPMPWQADDAPGQTPGCIQIAQRQGNGPSLAQGIGIVGMPLEIARIPVAGVAGMAGCQRRAYAHAQQGFVIGPAMQKIAGQGMGLARPIRCQGRFDRLQGQFPGGSVVTTRLRGPKVVAAGGTGISGRQRPAPGLAPPVRRPCRILACQTTADARRQGRIAELQGQRDQAFEISPFEVLG